MRNLIDRLTARELVTASSVTLATLIVLNGMLVPAARKVSTELPYLVPLLVAVISYTVGIVAMKQINKNA